MVRKPSGGGLCPGPRPGECPFPKTAFNVSPKKKAPLFFCFGGEKRGKRSSFFTGTAVPFGARGREKSVEKARSSNGRGARGGSRAPTPENKNKKKGDVVLFCLVQSFKKTGGRGRGLGFPFGPWGLEGGRENLIRLRNVAFAGRRKKKAPLAVGGARGKKVCWRGRGGWRQGPAYLFGEKSPPTSSVNLQKKKKPTQVSRPSPASHHYLHPRDRPFFTLWGRLAPISSRGFHWAEGKFPGRGWGTVVGPCKGPATPSFLGEPWTVYRYRRRVSDGGFVRGFGSFQRGVGPGKEKRESLGQCPLCAPPSPGGFCRSAPHRLRRAGEKFPTSRRRPGWPLVGGRGKPGEPGPRTAGPRAGKGGGPPKSPPGGRPPAPGARAGKAFQKGPPGNSPRPKAAATEKGGPRWGPGSPGQSGAVTVSGSGDAFSAQGEKGKKMGRDLSMGGGGRGRKGGRQTGEGGPRLPSGPLQVWCGRKQKSYWGGAQGPEGGGSTYEFHGKSSGGDEDRIFFWAGCPLIPRLRHHSKGAGQGGALGQKNKDFGGNGSEPSGLRPGRAKIF